MRVLGSMSCHFTARLMGEPGSVSCCESQITFLLVAACYLQSPLFSAQLVLHLGVSGTWGMGRFLRCHLKQTTPAETCKGGDVVFA